MGTAGYLDSPGEQDSPLGGQTHPAARCLGPAPILREAPPTHFPLVRHYTSPGNSHPQVARGQDPSRPRGDFGTPRGLRAGLMAPADLASEQSSLQAPARFEGPFGG